MRRTRIKICGITRLSDALAADQAGADAIGLVFHSPAKRCITIEVARQIVSELSPFVTPVALFVDAPLERIREVADALHVSHIQLHGHEPPEFVAKLDKFHVIKAIRADRAQLASELKIWRDANLPNVRAITLETPNTAQPGGTGIANDWEFIETAIAQGLFDGLPPLILAGGLTPENVAHVVRRIRPYAVDVSSGVEEQLGLKSPARIEAFVRAVREADSDDPAH